VPDGRPAQHLALPAVSQTVTHAQQTAVAQELADEIVRVVAALVDERLPRPADADTWLSIAEAATRAGCSTRSVHRALASGALVGGRVGRHRRIRASAVDAWVASPKEARPRPVAPALSRTGSMTSRGSPSSFVARVHRGVDS
jgi:excisionase family DNA binding protein